MMLLTTTMAAQFLAFVVVPYLLQALVLLSLVFIIFPMGPPSYQEMAGGTDS